MRKCHEATTIEGRPGVEVEVTIKDGDQWHRYRSDGWNEVMKLKDQVHYASLQGPGDYMTHNEAMRAGITATPPRTQGTTASQEHHPEMFLSAEEENGDSSTESTNTSRAGSVSFFADTENLRRPATKYARKPITTREWSRSPAPKHRRSKSSIGHRSGIHAHTRGGIMLEEEVVNQQSLMQESPPPIPSVSQPSIRTVENEWDQAYATPERSIFQSPPP